MYWIIFLGEQICDPASYLQFSTLNHEKMYLKNISDIFIIDWLDQVVNRKFKI